MPSVRSCGSGRAGVTPLERDTAPLEAQHETVRHDLPTGTVTFLFTDIEGSTKLLHALGAAAYAEALAAHRRILRDAFSAHGGVEVDTQGDAFFVAFPTAVGAVDAAAAARDGLAAGPIRVRMGIHTGTPHLSDQGYVGTDVHRAARIAACGHGGQVLISSSAAALVGTAGLRDLGEHRLKDLTAPERIHQLGHDGFPPLKTLHQTNLPVPVTAFLGRGPELAEIRALLAQPGARLLTLVGPGGTGKTRLALHAAGGSTEAYPHGVWWVPLDALRDPRLVLDTAAHALGAKNDLAEHIGDRSMLLLLDNFEQVSEAASDIAGLLAACPNLHVLVTSREPLHIAGEQQYPVPPLVPEEGIALFLARARAIHPGFESDAAVAQICRRLDDLPLALELAAARVKGLSSAQLLERLERRLALLTGGSRDLPARQRTLRAAIEWSHELLTPEEQRHFRQLAVFRGGGTLDAVEAVIGADLDVLTSLVDKSLVRQLDGRFSMLETIREYAAEQLESSGEAAAVHRRHAAHFLALAEEADDRLWHDGIPVEWLDRLEAEHDNLRAALDRLEAAADAPLALRFVGVLWRFWNARGHLVEGRRRILHALAADERPTAARARALLGASSAAARSGDPVVARSWAEQALALNRALGDPMGAALAQCYLATAMALVRDWATARRLFEDGIRMLREVGETEGLLATWLLAWMCRELGELEQARHLTAETLMQARAAGYRRVEAMSLGALAMLDVDDGRLPDALAMLTEAYRIDRTQDYRLEVALDLCRFARAAAAIGAWRSAARLIAKSDALREEVGESLGSWSVMEVRFEATVAAIRAQLDAATFAEAWDAGCHLSLDDALALALHPGG